jgi:hypothetical protein|eukprot:COSAG01_NODE_9357_length_2470_cov_675.651202_2_plen_65_part_00
MMLIAQAALEFGRLAASSFGLRGSAPAQAWRPAERVVRLAAGGGLLLHAAAAINPEELNSCTGA